MGKLTRVRYENWPIFLCSVVFDGEACQEFTVLKNEQGIVEDRTLGRVGPRDLEKSDN
jgi:hypothetical protein